MRKHIDQHLANYLDDTFALWIRRKRIIIDSSTKLLMVGVPGKSKGCKTCRKRKIAVSTSLGPLGTHASSVLSLTHEALCPHKVRSKAPRM